MKKTKGKTAHGISDGVRWGDLRINIYRGQNNANDIKNGANGANDVNFGVDGVKNGANELAYTDKDIPDQIQRLLKLIAENPTETQAQYAEIRTDKEKIHPLAAQMLSIDLNDGVKKNCAIFRDVLAEIK